MEEKKTEIPHILKIDDWDVDLPTGDWTGPDPVPLFPQFGLSQDADERLVEIREQNIHFNPNKEQHALILEWVNTNIPENVRWLFHGLDFYHPQIQLVFHSLPSIHLKQTKYEPNLKNQHLKAVYEEGWDEQLDECRTNFLKFLDEIKCPYQFVTESQALDNGMIELKDYKRPHIIGSQDSYPGLSNPPKKLWRYFTLTKFVSLLQSESIWFSRPQYFDDPHEFTMDINSQKELFQWKLDSFAREYNRAVTSGLKTFIASASPLIKGLPISKNGKIDKSNIKLSNLSQALLSSIRNDIQNWQESFCISCWRYSPYDSIAMWSQYATLEEGIALVVDLDDLRKSLKKWGDIRLAIVEYRDFSDHTIVPMRMNPLTYKDIRYETEAEARFYFRASPHSRKGVAVPFDLANVVKEIHLSPNASSWFRTNVQGLLDKYGVRIPLEESSLGKSSK